MCTKSVGSFFSYSVSVYASVIILLTGTSSIGAGIVALSTGSSEGLELGVNEHPCWVDYSCSGLQGPLIKALSQFLTTFDCS
jgi:hypothetical protein